MLKRHYYLLLLLLVFSCKEKHIYKDALIIKGGTIIDVSKNGSSIKDMTNKAIIIKSDTIFDIVALENLVLLQI